MALSARLRCSSSSAMMIMDDLMHNMHDDERKMDDEVTLEEFLKEEEEEVRVKRDQVVVIGSEKKGRGRKRADVDDPVDRAAVQRQKRMIKNRESAARSRERKQAYTLELETLVLQLGEENAKLLREQEELQRERLKQLMENLIPVTEKRKPQRILRRTHSNDW